MRYILAVCFVFGMAPLGKAQTSQAGPDQVALDKAVRLGTVAALAPVCGLREEKWAFDLRRAMVLEATRAGRPDDATLKAAPGSNLVVGALSFAEAEALESFAEGTPATICEPLFRSGELAEADSIVQNFQQLKLGLRTGS